MAKKLSFEILVVVAWLLIAGHATAQIPVEVFTGDKKASFDLMFFKYFKNKTGENSRFLFFSRERALVDYQQTPTSRLPQFGFTEAVSYNLPALKGMAPVLVGQVLNNGAFAKTGIQYARVTPKLTVFGWSVISLENHPVVDVFLMLRYTPLLTKQWRFYSQIEFINAFSTAENAPHSFTQRLRLGLKRKDWQFGLAADYVAFGRETYSNTQNTGAFLRHEF